MMRSCFRSGSRRNSGPLGAAGRRRLSHGMAARRETSAATEQRGSALLFASWNCEVWPGPAGVWQVSSCSFREQVSKGECQPIGFRKGGQGQGIVCMTKRRCVQKMFSDSSQPQGDGAHDPPVDRLQLLRLGRCAHSPKRPDEGARARAQSQSRVHGLGLSALGARPEAHGSRVDWPTSSGPGWNQSRDSDQDLISMLLFLVSWFVRVSRPWNLRQYHDLDPPSQNIILILSCSIECLGNKTL